MLRFDLFYIDDTNFEYEDTLLVFVYGQKAKNQHPRYFWKETCDWVVQTKNWLTQWFIKSTKNDFKHIFYLG